MGLIAAALPRFSRLSETLVKKRNALTLLDSRYSFAKHVVPSDLDLRFRSVVVCLPLPPVETKEARENMLEDCWQVRGLFFYGFSECCLCYWGVAKRS